MGIFALFLILAGKHSISPLSMTLDVDALDVLYEAEVVPLYY